MKIERSAFLPLVLLAYLGVMAFIGWPAYADGRTSAFQYFGTVAATVVVIVLLFFSLRRRDRLRRERIADMNRADGSGNGEYPSEKK